MVDLAAPPVARAPRPVEVLARKLFSHRKRLVGGFYAYDHVQETASVGELCRGRTDAPGLACEGPAAGGQAASSCRRPRPTPRGARSRPTPRCGWRATTTGGSSARDSDRMDVAARAARYEPGETARFQVRMPFREATALVTVEREGVFEARV